MLNSLSNNCPYKEGKETTNYSSDILQEIKSPLSEIISPSTKYLDNETHLQIVGAETIKEIRKKVFKYFSELIGIPLSNEPWRDEVINYQPRAFSQLFGVGREQTNEEVNEYTFLDLIPRNDRGALYKQLESLGLKKGYLRKSEVSGEEILEWEDEFYLGLPSVFGKEDVLCLIVESTRWFWTMNPSYSKGRLQRFNLQEKSSQGELTLDVKLGRKCPLQTHNREKITKFFRENPDKKAIDLMGTCEPSFPDWMNEDVYEIIDYRGNVHIAKVDPSRQWMSEGLERKIIKSESGISWNLSWTLIVAWRLKSYYDATSKKQVEIKYKS